MPWLETSSMTERKRFIDDTHRGLFSMTELCARFGISRKTGYKWLDRYDAQGQDGLRDRSHAPEACPHKISADVAGAICEMRRAHPSWGPRKLLAALRRRQRTPAPARAQHGGGFVGSRRTGQKTGPAPAACASGRGGAAHHAAQRPLDVGL